MNNEKIYFYIWLSGLEISPSTKIKLLKMYDEPENLFQKKRDELEKTLNAEEIKINEENKKILIEKILDPSTRKNIKQKIDTMQKLKINVITYKEKLYPKELKQIYDYPICLYYKGNINLLKHNKKIAVIGCREYSKYGQKVALDFATKLAQNNFVVVSGCARGIDSFSHLGTLKYKAKTIGILGNSLEYIYPPENKNLEEQILKQEGLLVSEYLIGTKPSKYTFPSRNRIISGISNAILVIEAKQKSGTLITVDFGLDQGKNIYAIPGNITSTNSTGTNELIKLGAKAVTKIEDILEDF